jgi:pimeloyl-ACP methyl ester carboxylesterase
MLFGLPAQGQAQKSNWLKGFKDPSKHDVRLSSHGVFFVNGHYYISTTNQSPPGFGLPSTVGLKYMAGQMYVEYWIPKKVKYQYPIVLIHGGAQTGAGFISTPDGRPGWAQFFVANGYVVYNVDQVGRGRDVHDFERYGVTRPPLDVLSRQQNWSLQRHYNWFPRAYLHTQWPGTGLEGDSFFDQFYASQVQFIADPIKTQEYAQQAGVALLDKIGPAIILTHSQSGTYGFLIADKRPNLVKGVVTIEGGGTPYTYPLIGPPTYYGAPVRSALWGLVSIPITYSPAVTDPSQLSFFQEATPGGPDVRCYLQVEPARQLPNLQRMPHLLLVGEASSAASVNRCVSKYLTQAGVHNTWVDLGQVGIHGNGHMMMLEKNSNEVAAFIASWLQDNVERKR